MAMATNDVEVSLVGQRDADHEPDADGRRDGRIFPLTDGGGDGGDGGSKTLIRHAFR